MSSGTSSIRNKLSHLDQYDGKNNLVLSGIPNLVNDDDLENSVTSTLSNIDAFLHSHHIEDCHRICLTDKNKLKRSLFDYSTVGIAKKLSSTGSSKN